MARWRHLAASRRGAVALEFALVAVPFLTFALGAVEVGYDLFVQSVLDTALGVTGRAIQAGSITGTSGQSSAQFAAAAVCPNLAGLLDCSRLTVAVRPVPSGYNYYTNTTAPTWTAASSGSGIVCTGTGGQRILLQAWYAGPTALGSLVPAFSTSYQGSLIHLTTAAAGFVNEPFTGGQTTGSGC